MPPIRYRGSIAHCCFVRGPVLRPTRGARARLLCVAGLDLGRNILARTTRGPEEGVEQVSNTNSKYASQTTTAAATTATAAYRRNILGKWWSIVLCHGIQCLNGSELKVWWLALNELDDRAPKAPDIASRCHGLALDHFRSSCFVRYACVRSIDSFVMQTRCRAR